MKSADETGKEKSSFINLHVEHNHYCTCSLEILAIETEIGYAKHCGCETVIPVESKTDCR